MTYAAGTPVPAERTKAEIERILNKHGASSYGVLSELDKATIVFVISGKKYRLVMPFPSRMITRDHAQAVRERWRCTLLLVKAKLEMVALGISTVEREFLADLLLANGKTVSENMNERTLMLPGATPVS